MFSTLSTHLESQRTTSQASPTGRHYINHLERGPNILLFVRRTGKVGTRTAPYILMGFADYVSHERHSVRRAALHDILVWYISSGRQ